MSTTTNNRIRAALAKEWKTRLAWEVSVYCRTEGKEPKFEMDVNKLMLSLYAKFRKVTNSKFHYIHYSGTSKTARRLRAWVEERITILEAVNTVLKGQI